jgi:hypothetical protein
MPKNALTWIWLAGICLQIILAIALVVRQAWRKFPVFSFYFIFNLLQSTAMLVLTATETLHPRAYFYSFWGLQVLVLLLGLGVMFEVFMRLLTSYPTIKRTVVPACFVAVVVLMFFDAMAMYGRHPSGDLSLMVPFLRAEETVRVVQAGMVVFLYVCAGFFRLHLREVEFGIALGLGIFATLQLIGVVLTSHFGVEVMPATGTFEMLSFDVAVLIWLRYFTARNVGHWPNSRHLPDPSTS